MLTIDEIWYAEALHLRLPDAGTGYVVTIPVHGAFGAVHRGRALDADPARAVVFQPDGDVDLRCGANCVCYAVWIDTSVLADVLEHRLGHAVHRPLELAATLDLSTPAGRTWAGLIRLLVSWPVLRHPLLADPVRETRRGPAAARRRPPLPRGTRRAHPLVGPGPGEAHGRRR